MKKKTRSDCPLPTHVQIIRQYFPTDVTFASVLVCIVQFVKIFNDRNGSQTTLEVWQKRLAKFNT